LRGGREIAEKNMFDTRSKSKRHVRIIEELTDQRLTDQRSVIKSEGTYFPRPVASDPYANGSPNGPPYADGKGEHEGGQSEP